MKSRLLIVLLTTAMAIACTRGTVMHHYETIDNDGWSRTDTLSFPVPEIKNEGSYRIQLELRYNSLFPYEALWMVAETHFTQPDIMSVDTICLVTADTIGRPIGRGVVLLQSDTLITNKQLIVGQKGEIRLRHIMQREVLPGIHDVGVKVSCE